MPASTKKVTKPAAKRAASLEKGIAKVKAANAAKRAKAAAKSAKPAKSALLKANEAARDVKAIARLEKVVAKANGKAKPAAPVIGSQPNTPEGAAILNVIHETAAKALTATERKAIEGILASDYMDGMTGADAVNHAVWTWSANPFSSKRTFSGAVSSLVQKGFAVIGGVGKDATIAITRAGMDAFDAAPAAKAEPVAKAASKPAKGAKAKPAATKPAKAAQPSKADKPAGATGAKATVLAMIETAGKAGVSAAEIAKKLGWPRAGGTISRAIKLATFKVAKLRDADGVLRYSRA